MTNILPHRSQKKIETLNRAHYVIVTSIVLSLASLIAYGVLLPSYLVLSLNPGVAPEQNIFSQDEINTDKSALKYSQDLLNVFAPVVASTTPTDAIRTALSLQPRGIHINHINYTAGKTGQLILEGTTDTTDALNVFRTALLSSKTFTSVDVPLGMLIGSEDGSFNITLTGAF